MQIHLAFLLFLGIAKRDPLGRKPSASQGRSTPRRKGTHWGANRPHDRGGAPPVSPMPRPGLLIDPAKATKKKKIVYLTPQNSPAPKLTKCQGGCGRYPQAPRPFPKSEGVEEHMYDMMCLR